jgi:fatty-acyl-CoA synthase
MRGRMMDWPLTVSSIIEHAARFHGSAEIVSRTVEGPIHRYTYRDAERRCKRLANALNRLGVGPGDRVATIAWNGYRHFELYYGISGIGAVCHTVNPRLSPEQFIYVFNHAKDQALFFDLTFLPLVEKLAAHFKSVRHFVAMTDRAHMPANSSLKNLLCYDELLAAESEDLEWPRLDEWTASSLCYTSGTTGNPKGALYTHRSTVLHSMAVCSADNVGMSSRDSICPIVPMFHVNAWGVPYAAAMCGAKLVFPGPALDGKSLHQLFDAEAVTCTLGVPTVWLGLLKHMEETQSKFATLRRLLVGGSAAPPAMMDAFWKKYGVEAIHGWGMTELSPVGAVATLKGVLQDRPEPERRSYLLKQGRPLFGVEMKIVDPEGRRLPEDGKATGELLVRGPWVIGAYFDDEPASKAAFDGDGWFRTGDVCSLDEHGYVQVMDRSKDVIKSGGEWISSIDLENAVMGHPAVQEAAVIAVKHPKWDERPLLVVVAKPGPAPTKPQIADFLAGKFPKWMLPDDVVFVAELPHTATGKVQKSKLRETYKDYRLPTA